MIIYYSILFEKEDKVNFPFFICKKKRIQKR